MNGVALRSPVTVDELASRLGGVPDVAASTRCVDRVVAPFHAERDRDLVVVTSARFAETASERPGVVLCSTALAERAPAGRRWSHPHAEWALAELLDESCPPAGSAEPELGARRAPDASTPAEVLLEPGAIVMPGARIGPGSVIGPNAVVYGCATLGQRVRVGAGAVIGRPGFGWVTGPEGRARRMPQPGGVVLEDDVEIGALCTVDSGTLAPTRICARSKLDAQVHVGHNVEIGPDCLIAAQSGFAGSVRLGARVLVGGQAGFKDHVRVGDGARVAAKSGVVGDVPAGAVVAGFPAVPRWVWLRSMARLLELGKRTSAR